MALVWATFQPFAGDGGDEVAVRIPKSASAGEIGDLLDSKGIVQSAALFEVCARPYGETAAT